MMMQGKPTRKPPSVRRAENARYQMYKAALGIMRVVVHVPAERVPELRALTLAWRAEAKILFEKDRPSADQILQIHGVCRTLGLDLPVTAFATRAAAAHWLLTYESRLALRQIRIPTVDQPFGF